MFYCSSCFQCPLWKPTYSCNGGYIMNTQDASSAGRVGLQREEREGRPQSDKLCHLRPGSQCLWPQSHSLTCIQFLPHQSTQITWSRAIQHQMLPLLNAHICCLSPTPWHKPLSSSTQRWHNIGLPMNNQLIHSRVS